MPACLGTHTHAGVLAQHHAHLCMTCSLPSAHRVKVRSSCISVLASMGSCGGDQVNTVAGRKLEGGGTEVHPGDGQHGQVRREESKKAGPARGASLCVPAWTGQCKKAATGQLQAAPWQHVNGTAHLRSGAAQLSMPCSPCATATPHNGRSAAQRAQHIAAQRAQQPSGSPRS